MFNNKLKKAFTLLELIVVIVVLGILAMLAVPTFNTVKEKSADSVALKNAQALQREYDAMVELDPTTTPNTMVVGEGQYGQWVINGSTYNYKANEAGKVPALNGVNKNMYKN